VVDVVVIVIARISTENMLLYVVLYRGKPLLITGSIFTLLYGLPEDEPNWSEAFNTRIDIGLCLV